MKTAAFLLLLISGQAIINISVGGQDADVCTTECRSDTYLECPTFVDYQHCQNCCTIKHSDCKLRYKSDKSVACKGEGRFCPLYCITDTVVMCGDVVYDDRCENCCTVAFTNCAILTRNGTVICKGIGFKPKGST